MAAGAVCCRTDVVVRSDLVQTALGGIAALWTAVLLLAILIVLTSTTRTLRTSDLIQPFCLGGAMPGLAILAGLLFDSTLGTGDSRLRPVVIPAVEEALKILPVLWLLWRLRMRRLTLGASDVLLIAVACGIGFGWVEDAFIRHNRGWTGSVDWLPTTETYGDRHGTYLIAGACGLDRTGRSSWATAKTALLFLRVRNQFAYATARAQRETGLDKEKADNMAWVLEAVLKDWWFRKPARTSGSTPSPQAKPAG